MEFVDADGCDYMNFEFSENCEAFNNADRNIVFPKNEKIKLKERKVTAINFDFYGLEFYIASDRFLSLCDNFDIPYISEKCTILFKGNEFKNFYFFSPKNRCSIIDEGKSIFEVDEFSTDTKYKHYSLIEKLVPRKNLNQKLFYCTDIDRIVCADLFRESASKDIKNIKFTKIDNYIYDPFHKYSGKFGNL